MDAGEKSFVLMAQACPAAASRGIGGHPDPPLIERGRAGRILLLVGTGGVPRPTGVGRIAPEGPLEEG
ncbi:aminopeptidase N [Actinomyces sp. Chiba101]|nr:aminopeptidase N [Actinomyces sp. Chiba101]GAV95009.1 aminopeptidase N [Actinomyces denticolens]